MRKAAVLFVSLIALPLLAADAGYRFHIQVTDGRTALLANPSLAEMHLTDAQIEKAGDDRVLVLDHAQGAKWKWLMLSWATEGPTPKWMLNDQGTSTAALADISIEPIDYQRFRARCLRAQCRFATTSADGRDVVTGLERGATTELRFKSDIAVSFVGEH
jgi:hypothetical protein